MVPIVGADEDQYWLPEGYSTYNGYIVSPDEVKEVLAELNCVYELDNPQEMYEKISVLFRHDVPSELDNKEMPIKASAKLFGLRE